MLLTRYLLYKARILSNTYSYSSVSYASKLIPFSNGSPSDRSKCLNLCLNEPDLKIFIQLLVRSLRILQFFFELRGQPLLLFDPSPQLLRIFLLFSSLLVLGLEVDFSNEVVAEASGQGGDLCVGKSVVNGGLLSAIDMAFKRGGGLSKGIAEGEVRGSAVLFAH